jgi:hypothetical protein
LIEKTFPNLSKDFIKQNKIKLVPNLDDGFEDDNSNITYLTIYVKDRNQSKTYEWGGRTKVSYETVGSFKVLLSYPMVSPLLKYNTEEENHDLLVIYDNF